MAILYQKITIVRYNKPIKNDINEELQWVGNSLGLFNLRDKDKSCFRIFIELLKTAKESKRISSDEMAHKLDLSRGTVVHHINKMIEAGIIIREGNKYILRNDSLQSLVDQIESDAKQACKELRAVAKEIDERIGLK